MAFSDTPAAPSGGGNVSLSSVPYRIRPRAARGLTPVLRVLGVVLVVFSVIMLVPVAVAFGFQDEARYAYDEAFIITLSSGAVLYLVTRRGRYELEIRDGFLLVTLVWAVLPVFGALPLLFYFNDLGFTDAYFEAISGLTTTGATVLSRLDELPPSINLWRALLEWVRVSSSVVEV